MCRESRMPIWEEFHSTGKREEKEPTMQGELSLSILTSEMKIYRPFASLP
jgi:hypothetical protein